MGKWVKKYIIIIMIIIFEGVILCVMNAFNGEDLFWVWVGGDEKIF